MRHTRSFDLGNLSYNIKNKISGIYQTAWGTNLNEAFETDAHHFEPLLRLTESGSVNGPEGESWSEVVGFFFTRAEGPNLGLQFPEEIHENGQHVQEMFEELHQPGKVDLMFS